MREKLASIRKIKDLLSIEGKDRIELAIVDGWQVIVQKNLYQKDQLVIFIETDSILPETKDFEFMSKYKYHVKTLKLGNTLSQGLIMPITILPKKVKIEENKDVTKILGITQFEEEIKPKKSNKHKKHKLGFLYQLIYNIINKYTEKKKKFPYFIRKTDEDRIQNHPEYLDTDIEWYGTEKIDGTSSTFFLKKGFLGKKEFGVCSRNIRLLKDDSVYWQVAEKYNIKNKLSMLLGNNKWIAIQGEIIAPNILKNKYNVKEPVLYVYSIIKPSGRLNYFESMSVCKEINLNHVPLLFDNKTINLKGKSVLSVLSMANGNSDLNKDSIREGVVFRSDKGNKSFKAVSPMFLLKYKM